MTSYKLGKLVVDVLMETGIEIQPIPIWEDEWEHPESRTFCGVGAEACGRLGAQTQFSSLIVHSRSGPWPRKRARVDGDALKTVARQSMLMLQRAAPS